MPRYSKGASKSVESAMERKNKGTLRSGPGGRGGKVTSAKQAIAIGLSEAREKGAKVPPPKKKSATKKSATKKPATKKSARKAAPRKKAATRKRTTSKKSAARKSSM